MSARFAPPARTAERRGPRGAAEPKATGRRRPTAARRACCRRRPGQRPARRRRRPQRDEEVVRDGRFVSRNPIPRISSRLSSVAIATRAAVTPGVAPTSRETCMRLTGRHTHRAGSARSRSWSTSFGEAVRGPAPEPYDGTIIREAGARQGGQRSRHAGLRRLPRRGPGPTSGRSRGRPEGGAKRVVSVSVHVEHSVEDGVDQADHLGDGIPRCAAARSAADSEVVRSTAESSRWPARADQAHGGQGAPPDRVVPAQG